MPAKESAEVQRAMILVLAGTHTIVAAADAEGLSTSTVRRALRRHGEPPRKSLKGPAHPHYIDGSTPPRRQAPVAG